VDSLAMALVESSKAPLLLLDDEVVVLGASSSFCNAFNLDPLTIASRSLADLGAGEWDVPQLDSLLRATTHLNEANNPFLQPGITIKTSPTDYVAFEQLRMFRYHNARWAPFGTFASVRP